MTRRTASVHRSVSIPGCTPGSIPGRRALLLAFAALATIASAQTPLSTERIADGLVTPLWAGSPPDDDRLFVIEQTPGLIRILAAGAVLPTPFLDVGSKITAGGELGLLGLAFHPDYQANGRFFIVYTDLNGDSVLARYEVSAADPDVADPATETILLQVAQPFTHHNGGGLAFGPLDGYLYMALGDGGDAGDPFCNAQDPASLLGKILRLDVDGAEPYAVPPDNPLVGVPGALPEIWSLGLRNPWRFAFDSLTGDMYIGDVGGALREEIDFEPALAAGFNYGWRVMEGTLCQGPGSCVGVPACGNPVLVDPVHQYEHVFPDGGCAVIGGQVYRGCAIPDLAGTYFFGDYCTAKIWSFEIAGGVVTNFQDRTFELAPGGGLVINVITSFGTDRNGEILIVDQGGEIFKIVSGDPAPDCDGNGENDACEIAGDPTLDLNGNGTLDACEDLGADVAGVSISGGGTQNLFLHPGAAFADHPFQVLGSLAGTSPGFTYLGVTIPLNVDAYFLKTVSQPDTVPLIVSTGTLDANGEGAGVFQVPAGSPPSFVGLTVNHAFGLRDPVTSLPVHASNAIPVQLLP